MSNYNSLYTSNFIFQNAHNKRSCVKDELISYQNEKAQFAYLILSGKVITRANTNAQGKALTDRELKIGSSIGLFDIILEQNYTRSAIAKSKTLLAVMDYKIVTDCLNYTNIIMPHWMANCSLLLALLIIINIIMQLYIEMPEVNRRSKTRVFQFSSLI